MRPTLARLILFPNSAALLAFAATACSVSGRISELSTVGGTSAASIAGGGAASATSTSTAATSTSITSAATSSSGSTGRESTTTTLSSTGGTGGHETTTTGSSHSTAASSSSGHTTSATSTGGTSSGATTGSSSSSSSSSSNSSSSSSGQIDAGVPSAGCGLTGAPTGDLNLTTTDGNGTTRQYEVLVPTTYDSADALALAFVYHGAGATSATAKGFGLQDAPGAANAGIFVFPQGIAYENYGVGWDDLCGGYDMVFFDHMLASLESAYCIDESRVYVAGFSWGCDQVTALACCRGDRLRAIGAASCTDEYADAGIYQTYDNLPCPVQKGVPIRFTHDASGGDSAYPKPLFTTTSELYRSFNACGSASTPVSPSPCESYTSCAQDFIECPYPNLGHALPPNWGDDTWSFLTNP